MVIYNYFVNVWRLQIFYFFEFFSQFSLLRRENPRSYPFSYIVDWYWSSFSPVNPRKYIDVKSRVRVAFAIFWAPDEGHTLKRCDIIDYNLRGSRFWKRKLNDFHGRWNWLVSHFLSPDIPPSYPIPQNLLHLLNASDFCICLESINPRRETAESSV